MAYKELTQEQRVGRWINRLRFKSKVWENGWEESHRSYITDIVIIIRKECGITPPNRTYDEEVKFIHEGLKYCQIYGGRYQYALSEFKALIWGDW